MLSSAMKLDLNDFVLADQGLSLNEADRMSENVIATYDLPMSVAANFVIDGEPVLVPMVTEEPSIVAACSKMAKMVALSSGFSTQVDEALIKGQIQLCELRDIDHALTIFYENRAFLIDKANALCPSMVKRKGGVIDIEVRVVPHQLVGPMLLIEPIMDVVDAMGANAINTVLEGLSAQISLIFGGRVGLRILSNLCDKRLATASFELPFQLLSTSSGRDDGFYIAKGLLMAHAMAEADIYRAATHNKGIMNGIDAVALATGNDFRALEAGAHAFAALNGRYRPLTSMDIDLKRQSLKASLTLPMAVGVVGGMVGLHPGVRLAHKILGNGARSAKRLAGVMASVGLAQCLAALLALSQEGIQKGHMRLHHKKSNKGQG